MRRDKSSFLPRTFIYSSLSRLVSTTNPESGTATYTYYPNGALKTKTDARNVSITYTVDGLSRVKKKDYTATTPVTPAARYCYDGEVYDSTTDSCVADSTRAADHAQGALTHTVARNGSTIASDQGWGPLHPDPLPFFFSSRRRIRSSRESSGREQPLREYMPRKPRCVLPGVFHHVTQRGVGRCDVFETVQDRVVYLRLLAEELREGDVSVLAYCLMTNHVHWIVRPGEADSLARLFRRVHGRYAQYFNPARHRCGHLWQNRYFSCPLSAAALRAVVRYVELNPVRAGMVKHAEDYPWSSASAHLLRQTPAVPLHEAIWGEFGEVAGWRELLAEPVEEEGDRRLRRCTYSGMPYGEPAFVAEAESVFGRQWRPGGRPPKVAAIGSSSSC